MFKPIEGYEGLYEISPEGQVRNARTARPIPVKSGRVILSKKGAPTAVLVKDLAPSTTGAPTIFLRPKTSKRIVAEESYGPWANKAHGTMHTGAAGENLVCAVLEKHGVFASRPPYATASYDIIGDFGRGHFFTVQVKSSACATARSAGVTDTYKFSVLPAVNDACDVYAFVALNTFKVVFELARNVKAISRSFMRLDFDAKAQDSVANVLHQLYSEQA